MRKQYFKHIIHFTATLSLCAAILAGNPSNDLPDPGTGNNEPQIGAEEQENEKVSERKSGVTPQSDREPEERDQQ